MPRVTGDSESDRQLMSGNEAIARGALEAGMKFCASYPGTPSTEITSTLMQMAERYNLYVEWSVNEKVALEACAGASWAGIPTICPMKSLGLNVASDFLLNLNLSGTGEGGLVIVVCDDPRGHSSSNEQDSRFYAKAAYVPLLEPSTCQQAKDIIPYALDLSQRHQVPVLVRSTTRLSHSRAIVKLGQIPEKEVILVDRMPDNLFNVPNPHLRHRDLIDTLGDIHDEFEQSPLNTLTSLHDSEILLLASGVGCRYAQDALSLLGARSVDVVNLVTTYPLPLVPLFNWVQDKKDIIFIEEVDPFIEEQVLALSAELEWEQRSFWGKRNGAVPIFGELNTNIVMEAVAQVLGRSFDTIDNRPQEALKEAKSLLIPRPLTFCAGCTHRNVYWALRKLRQRLEGKLVVAGDIGCYSLGVFYDNAMTTMQAMGSGIGVASGLGQLHLYGFDSKVVAVAGDSTFFHSCLPGLVNAKHKNADITFLILDNGTTAMTGFQPHPGSSVQAEKLSLVSIEKMVKSVDPDFVARGDGTNVDSCLDLIDTALNMRGLKVVIFDSICRLEEQRGGREYSDLSEMRIDSDLCQGEKCRICVNEFACPALEWDFQNGKARIIQHMCVRCGACIAVCPHDAIKQEDTP